MSQRPRVFISAVSSELRSARQLVANTLLALGYEPVWQDIFGTEQGDLREMLRRQINTCDGLVQLVGHCHGFEPPAPDETFGRVSYTQYEALYARSKSMKVWYLTLDSTFLTDTHEPEPEEKRALQEAYSQKVRSTQHLFHPLQNPDALEAKVFKLRDELADLRRRGKQWAMLVLVLLLVLVGGVTWLMRGQKHSQKQAEKTDEKVTTLVDRYQKMEQALIKLADAEMHAKQLGEKLTPDQLRQRAYTILENDLGIEAGTLSKELPAFALGLYHQDDTSLLMRARAAYALNKFEEAEKLFLESEAKDKKALENADKSADKLHQQRIEALKGAGNSAMAQIHYSRALKHYRAAAALTSEQRDKFEWASVECDIAYILNLNGQYHEAEEIGLKVSGIYQSVLGAQHPNTLNIRNNIAVAFYKQGKNAEAEKENRAVLAIRERVLGAEHPDTLASRDNLALALAGQGKYAEAEKENRTALAISVRVLGAEHPNTLNARNNLALALNGQGKNAEAEKEWNVVLAIRERALGAEHPDTLSSRSNLVSILYAQGKYAEAEKENRAVLAIRERVLGAEHPDTLSSRSNVAISLYYQGKYAEAEKENRAVLAIREHVLGAEHPDALSSQSDLALMLDMQGKYAEAEKENRAVLAIRERVLGSEHPDTLGTQSNLANTLDEQGKYAEAEKAHRAVLAIRERVLGAEHPNTLASRESLAIVLNNQSKYAEAGKEHRTVLAIFERVLGVEHPNTLSVRNNLAESMQQQGKWAEMEPEHRVILAARERTLGKANPAVYESCYNLALCLEAQKKLKEAFAFAERAEKGRKMALGLDHPDSKRSQQVRERIEAAINAQK